MIHRPYRSLVLLSAALLSLLVTASLSAEEILAPGVKIEKVFGDGKFTEGPAVDAQGNVFFSDGANDRIMRLDPQGKATVFRHPCGRANGMTFDHEGRLLMCQSGGSAGGGRKVTRLESDGSETVLAEAFEGRQFMNPNDLSVDHKGRIFFTDYGSAAERSQPVNGVYRIDAPGKVFLVVSDLGKPNGIAITSDHRLVYVSDRGSQKLHRYELQDDGSLKPAGIAYDFSPDRGIDGMRLDIQGNIYGAAGQDKTTGLFVISPQGKLLLHQPMPEFSTNLAFGGSDRRDIYFTAGKSLYRLKSVQPGASVPIPKTGP
jgi:gluconolactonase